jgi:succinate dehydrogenase / fumarate reductase iron-sulfur subunit
MGTQTSKNMNLKLKVWRQKNSQEKGYFEEIEAKNISPDMSFLEMLDVVNVERIDNNQEPIAFDHDCREGICGMCSLVINGQPHGKDTGTTSCQLHMRRYNDGDIIVIEPWRAAAFPVIKDLMVDRSAFDKIIQAGGFITVKAGSAPDANNIPVPKEVADHAMNAAECIGCGACVAACKNASASLFVSAKVSHLNTLPQGKAEAKRRALSMVAKMDELGFGACSNTYECEAACPKEISVENIAQMNRDYGLATLSDRNL